MRSTPLRLIRMAAFALALALLAAPTATATPETYFLDGYEVEVTLRPWRESFVVGEQVSIVLEFESRADRKFDTDAAFEGLKLAAADPHDDLRTVAAQALAAGKHPKAAARLLEMRTDEHFGVRLIVLHSLTMKDTEEARRIVWEMSNDEHPLVRETALRHLQQRGGRRP